MLVLVLCSAQYVAKYSRERIGVIEECSSCQQENIFLQDSDSNLLGGYGSFVGSLLWVRAIFTYAEVIFSGRDQGELSSLFKQSYYADKQWETPLLIGMWALSSLKRPDSSDLVWFMEEGSEAFPKNWKFRVAWAVYIQECNCVPELIVKDSVAKILIPLSASRFGEIPQYARNLAFTLLHKSGKPDQAMQILVQTLEQIPDPLIRHQYQRKIGDLLWRNQVSLGADSTAFLGGIGGMLNADSVQAGAAKQLLIRMVQPETKDAAVLEARHLAQQFRDFQSAQFGATR